MPWKIFVLPDIGYPREYNFNNTFETWLAARLFISKHTFMYYPSLDVLYVGEFPRKYLVDSITEIRIERCLLEVVKII